MYNLAVFIGRFAPFHLGHLRVVDQALEEADRVLILTGSSFAPASLRTPFSAEERIEMITRNYPGAVESGRIIFEPIEDYLYNNDDWVQQVQEVVYKHETEDTKICLIGHEKDGSTFYLKLFPQWANVGVKHYEGLDATDVRMALYERGDAWDQPWTQTLKQGTKVHPHVSRRLTPETIDFLKEWRQTEHYDTIMQEWNFIKLHDKAWEHAPYTPTFQTLDSMVVQSSHVLLINRRAYPGRGLWALPGGYLNPKEEFLDGAIRELYEETNIKVPVPVLHGSIVHEKVFANPYRSARGRIITYGYLFHLTAQTTLPKIRGGDDAKKDNDVGGAKWWPLTQVKRSMMFEDHFDIIHNFKSRLPDRQTIIKNKTGGVL